MRTTLDLPDALMKKVKLMALREGVTLKDWFVAHLRAEVEGPEAPPPLDEANRFRARFQGHFDPSEIDAFKRSGRA